MIIEVRWVYALVQVGLVVAAILYAVAASNLSAPWSYLSTVVVGLSMGYSMGWLYNLRRRFLSEQIKIYLSGLIQRDVQ